MATPSRSSEAGAAPRFPPTYRRVHPLPVPLAETRVCRLCGSAVDASTQAWVERDGARVAGHVCAACALDLRLPLPACRARDRDHPSHVALVACTEPAAVALLRARATRAQRADDWYPRNRYLFETIPAPPGVVTYGPGAASEEPPDPAPRAPDTLAPLAEQYGETLDLFAE